MPGAHHQLVFHGHAAFGWTRSRLPRLSAETAGSARGEKQAESERARGQTPAADPDGRRGAFGPCWGSASLNPAARHRRVLGLVRDTRGSWSESKAGLSAVTGPQQEEGTGLKVNRNSSWETSENKTEVGRWPEKSGFASNQVIFI